MGAFGPWPPKAPKTNTNIDVWGGGWRGRGGGPWDPRSYIYIYIYIWGGLGPSLGPLVATHARAEHAEFLVLYVMERVSGARLGARLGAKVGRFLGGVGR